MNRILCIKWGTKYSADYVNRLQKMLERHTTQPFELHCFTDQAEGIFEEIFTHPLPELGCEIPKTVPGKFPKIALWGNEIDLSPGPALFIDLDTVIVGNIDSYFEIGEEHDVFLAKNWAKPFTGLGQTSVFRFPIKGHTYILENLRKNTRELAEKYRFEQHYVTKNVQPAVKFWPDKWTKHFRLHCMGPWPLRYLKEPTCPEGAKIITFPGMPDPYHAVERQFFDSYPKQLNRLDYIKECGRICPVGSKDWWSRIKGYVGDTDWLKDLSLIHI